MATAPGSAAANTSPVAGPDATALDQAHADYVHDQLQQERTVNDHAATLKARAPGRIAAVKHARTAAGLNAAPSAADDGTAHFHVVARMLNEQAFYPAHDKRTESPDYAKVHNQMTVVDDKHCIVDVHHRHKFVGIHAVSFPIWGPQDVVSPELMAKQIELAKSKQDPAPRAGAATKDAAAPHGATAAPAAGHSAGHDTTGQAK